MKNSLKIIFVLLLSSISFTCRSVGDASYQSPTSSSSSPGSTKPTTTGATTGLTSAKVETAVNSLMSDFRLGGRIIVKGVQELPQQNAAVADLQFDNFEYGITNEGMTTISTKIPDTLFLHARSIAECEEITLDQFIALALTSQITSWETGQSFAKRAARRDWNKARELLAKAPDIEPDLIDAL